MSFSQLTTSKPVMEFLSIQETIGMSMAEKEALVMKKTVANKWKKFK